MPKITLYIPKDLQKKMLSLRDNINFSKLFQFAVEDKLKESKQISKTKE